MEIESGRLYYFEKKPNSAFRGDFRGAIFITCDFF